MGLQIEYHHSGFAGRVPMGVGLQIEYHSGGFADKVQLAGRVPPQ